MAGSLDVLQIQQSAERFLIFTGGVPPPPDAIFIMVMGMTGAGKSSFVAACSGQEVIVGHGLESCTSEIAIVDFELDGRKVYLIDTPGFNDTYRSDTETLRIIATYLGVSYAQGIRIHGIIYLHAIDDNRMTGSKQRNLDMVEALCGPKTYRNTAIATTMWSKLGITPEDTEKFASREGELRSDPFAFGELIAHGARLFRHSAGDQSQQSSAHAIVRHIIQQSWAPVTLAIQHELVDEKKTLEDTDAGIVLCAELREAIRKQAEDFRTEIERLLETGDKECAAEIKVERDRLREQSKRIQEETQAMAVSIETLRQRERTLYEEKLGRAEQELRDELASQTAELASMRQLLAQKRRQESGYVLDQEQKRMVESMLGQARQDHERQRIHWDEHKEARENRIENNRRHSNDTNDIEEITREDGGPHEYRLHSHQQHAQQEPAQFNHAKKQKELLELEKRIKEKEEAFALEVQRHHTARAKKVEYVQAISSAMATGAMGGMSILAILKYRHGTPKHKAKTS